MTGNKTLEAIKRESLICSEFTVVHHGPSISNAAKDI